VASISITSERTVLSPVQQYRRMGLVFGTAVMLQVGHFAEHIAQWYQREVTHVTTPPHGLLGVWLDVEWVHFIYNLALGLSVVMIYFGYRMYRREWREYSPVGWLALTGAMVFQAGWHVSEHAVKMYQWFVHDWNPAPGILGRTPKAGTGPFDLLYLHFWYNAIVTALLVFAFVAYRGYRRPAPEPLEARA
jgi:hypothetical protein